MIKSALKLSTKLFLTAFVVCLGFFVLPCSLVEAADECSKELLLEYFPKQFVLETLKKFNIPQDKWEAITTSLSNKDKDVVKIVEDKASKLNPNPLKDRDPQQRQVAVKLFRETLLQVFSDALQTNGISDSRQLQSMLDDIQQQKARNFAQCMEKQKASAQQVPQPQQQPEMAPTAPTQEQTPAKEEVPVGSPEASADEGLEPSRLVADKDQPRDEDEKDDSHDDSDDDNNDRKA